MTGWFIKTTSNANKEFRLVPARQDRRQLVARLEQGSSGTAVLSKAVDRRPRSPKNGIMFGL
jgi:hypothetical protein